MKVLWLPLLLVSVMLAGCGGAEVEQNPPPPVQEENSNYSGPAPQTDDIQLFKLTLWDNVALSSRCGACHVQGNTAPYFARNDDINLAYSAAQPLVNLADPARSLMVMPKSLVQRSNIPPITRSTGKYGRSASSSRPCSTRP